MTYFNINCPLCKGDQFRSIAHGLVYQCNNCYLEFNPIEMCPACQKCSYHITNYVTKSSYGANDHIYICDKDTCKSKFLSKMFIPTKALPTASSGSNTNKKLYTLCNKCGFKFAVSNPQKKKTFICTICSFASLDKDLFDVLDKDKFITGIYEDKLSICIECGLTTCYYVGVTQIKCANKECRWYEKP